MTPAIAEALAKILDAIGQGWSVRDNRGVTDGYHIPWPAEARMEAAGADLAAALGCGEAWDDVAVALRALARPDVGLPEGWRIGQPVTYPDGTQHTATAPDGGCVSLVVDPGGVRWFGIAAPPAVLFALLRAAGVAL
jgi:hypothetical protein